MEPQQGKVFFLLLPGVDRDCLAVFLREFRQFVQTARVGVVLDNSGSHRSGEVTWPEGIEPIPLPAYSPELNPAEKIFWELRQRLSNEVFEDVAKLQERLSEELRQMWDDPEAIHQLTGYSW